MTTSADLRHGHTRHATVVALASVFVPTTVAAWITWQAIEGGADTLTASEFRRWLTVSGCVAILVYVSAMAFWRTRGVVAGAAAGLLLAGLAVLGGLLVDLVASGAFA